MIKLHLFIVKIMRKIPGTQNFIWMLRSYFHAMERRLLVKRPVICGTEIIAQAISEKIPFAAGKMGSTEAAAVKTFLKRKEKSALTKSQIPKYSPYIFYTLFVNSGVFPQNEETFDYFCEKYINAVKACDSLVAWDVAGEANIFRHHCPHTTLIKLRSLEPYFSEKPWSHALLGKKVLVISPFSASIKKQFRNKEKIWGNRSILPDFELLTIKAPMSAGLVTPTSKDWFEALEKLKSQMDCMNYDVALIGAGAYSLPLAVHAKSRNKVGLHLGGSLQILFGIVGRRWREHKDFKPFITEMWCAPNAEETPENFKNNEGGCYW